MGFFSNFVNALKDPINIATAVVATAADGAGRRVHVCSVGCDPCCHNSGVVFCRSKSIPTPKLGDFASFASDASGRTQMVKQPITSRRAVYGQTRVSGPLAFIESTDEDKYLHLVVLLAAHECQEITTVFLMMKP